MKQKIRVEYRNYSDKHYYAIIWMEDENNMLTRFFMSELSRAVKNIREDPDVKGMILASGTPVFCSGASIEEMYPLKREEADRFGRIGRKLNLEIEALGKPSVAAVGGLCLGGGNELAISCTYRVAATRARFAQPEVSLGIIPGAGGSYRLPRLIGTGRAKELLYTGEMINARYAQRIGLVDRVVPPDDLIRTAEASLQELISGDKTLQSACTV